MHQRSAIWRIYSLELICLRQSLSQGWHWRCIFTIEDSIGKYWLKELPLLMLNPAGLAILLYCHVGFRQPFLFMILHEVSCLINQYFITIYLPTLSAQELWHKHALNVFPLRIHFNVAANRHVTGSYPIMWWWNDFQTSNRVLRIVGQVSSHKATTVFEARIASRVVHLHTNYRKRVQAQPYLAFACIKARILVEKPDSQLPCKLQQMQIYVHMPATCPNYRLGKSTYRSTSTSTSTSQASVSLRSIEYMPCAFASSFCMCMHMCIRIHNWYVPCYF